MLVLFEVLSAFWIGATISSFLGVLVMRLPQQQGWCEASNEQQPTLFAARSVCDHCYQPIRWIYLLPVLGYWLARGKCRQCQHKISWQYLLAEVIGGGLVVFSLFLSKEQVWLPAVLFLLLLFLAWIDIREHILPALVTFPLFWSGLLFSPFVSSAEVRASGGAAGFFLTWGAMAMVSRWRGQNIMAGGDIALITAAGTWFGLTVLPYYVLISSLTFMLYAFPARRRGIEFMPMGPALCIGFALCLVYAYR